MAAVLQEPTETRSSPAPTLDVITERQRALSIARRGLKKLTFKPFDEFNEHKGLYECGEPLPEATVSRLDVYPDGRVTIGGLKQCKNKQACPMCAGAGRIEDTATVAWRANEQLKKGRGLSFLTLAPRHAFGEALEPQLVCLQESFVAMMRSKKVKKVLESYGYEGHAKVLEVTCGCNGWHPHLHVLLFHHESIDVTENEEQELKWIIWTLFNEQLAKWATKAARRSERYVIPFQGKRRKETNREFYELPDTWRKDASWEHGIDFTPIKPDGDAGSKIAAYCGKIQLEMTRGDLKIGRSSTSRGYFQMLFDYGENPDPQLAASILEYLTAIKGTHLVTWSAAFKGNNPLHGQVPEDFYEKALEEYAEANGLVTDQTEDKVTVAGIEPSLHRQIDRTDATTGNPLLFELVNTYQTTRNLNDVIVLLNRNLPTPVYLNTDTEHPFPVITRQVELEPVQTTEERNTEYKEALDYSRNLGRQRRTQQIDNRRNQRLLVNLLSKQQLTERTN